MSLTTNNDFNPAKFNKAFDEDKAKKKIEIEKTEKERLAKLNKPDVNKPLYQLSVGEIIIGVKNTFFDIIDDLFLGKYDLQIFTKDNRLFFIGITCLLFSVILYLYDYFTNTKTRNNSEYDGKTNTDDNENDNVNNNAFKVYHIHQLVNPTDNNLFANIIPPNVIPANILPVNNIVK